MMRQCETCKLLDRLDEAVDKLTTTETVLLRIAAESLYFADGSDYKAALHRIVTMILTNKFELSEITGEMMQIINPNWND